MADTPEVTVQERLTALNESFRPSAPVHTQDLLEGRTDQLFALQEVASTPGESAAIFGERGVGKTSVASVYASIVDQNQNHNLCRINCSSMDSFSSLWRNAGRSLQSAGAPVATQFLEQGRLSQHDVLELTRSASLEKPTVVIFDEFDVLGDSGVGEDMANLMKAISDQGVDCHIVIVGVAEDVDSILSGHASVARNLRQVRMPRLNDKEIGSIVRTGLASVGLQVADSTVVRVIRLSQGLPHYAHLIGKNLGRRAILNNDGLVSEAHWSEALAEALDQTEHAVSELYAEAVTTAKPSMLSNLLLACALASKDAQGYFRPTDAGKVLERLEDRTLTVAAYTGNLANLAKDVRGPALQQRTFADKRKRYRFANPLLQPYVLMNAVLEGKIADSELTDESLWQGA